MVFLCHCILFVSCGNNNESDPDEIQISLKNMKCDTIKVAKLIQNMEIIPLENKNSHMISWPLKLSVTKIGFLIYDKPSLENEKVLYFNRQGRALNKIGAIGHGKGEYITIYDTATDRNGDTIIVTSMGKHYLYDKTGKFLSSNEYEIQPYGMIYKVAKTSSGYICSTDYSGADYQLHLYDKQLNLVEELLPTNNIINHNGYTSNHIQVDGNKVFYGDYHTSSLYCFDFSNTKQMKRYHFIDEEMFSLDKPNNEEVGVHDYTGLLVDYLENDNVICSLAHWKRETMRIKINTKTNEVRKFVYDGWMPLIWDYYDGHNYVIMDQTEFLECLKDEEYYESEITKSEFSKKLKQVYKSSGLEINEKSNYVILKF